MAIEIKDVDGGIGNIIIARGVVTGQEYIETHKRLLSQDKEKLEKYRYCLSDWTEITQMDVPTQDIKKVADLCISASKVNHDAIVAIVAHQDLIYGLARMFAALADETGWEIIVTRSMKKAESWIKKRVKDKFNIENLTIRSD